MWGGSATLLAHPRGNIHQPSSSPSPTARHPSLHFRAGLSHHPMPTLPSCRPARKPQR
ncbi:uncharacterized protein K441DRAFT_665254 [Cenococcum geophilum 1.58]|uniref:uncharacterized protein n=1 Tax=Cenococcum geophilum 1.58 TaxID=794803 RepID=UPI00358DE2E2|nr:hypothetical protein K441DRAFT_665254 [Cenococcum geophilum 1.58]